jgi:hypothetical protein
MNNSPVGDLAVGNIWRRTVSIMLRKALRSIPSPASPETALLTFCRDTGLLPPGVLIDAAKLCWQHRCQNMEAGRWPKEALRFSFEGSRGVGRPKARTGAVMSTITEQIQHTLNITKVTAQAKVNQPCVG